jgi:hypothetical protein
MQHYRQYQAALFGQPIVIHSNPIAAEDQKPIAFSD